ncbi:MAG: hypothetical protein R6W31_01960 [Bacteroidales bacterium]
MKTKSFLLIFCLFAGAAMMSLSAQSDTKSFQGWWNWPFYTEVYCDGAILGTVSGDLDFHYVVHVSKDYTETHIYQAKGLGTCDWSDETFTYKEVDKIDEGEGIYSWTYHLKGNLGSKFMGHVTWNMLTDEIIVGPATCK